MNTATIINSSNVPSNTIPAGFTKRADGNLLDAHKQWRSRPADEAVYSVEELLARTGQSVKNSEEISGIPWGELSAFETQGGRLAISYGNQKNQFAAVNNYSLGQLCALPTNDGCLAPAQFLTKLSTSTAVNIINERLQQGVDRTRQSSLLIVDGQNNRPILRCLNTEAYTRVWDYEIAQRVAALCARGTWQKADAFRRAGSQAPKHAWGNGETLPLGWVGDRSMFICLVDYEGGIEHNGQLYARFFLLSNSEVGAGSLKVTFGLLDYACCNFILWGCHEVYEASFKHTKNVRAQWEKLSRGFSRQLSSGDRQTITAGIDAASAYVIGKTEEEVIAYTRAATDLSKEIVQNAYKRAAATPRYGNPNSVWGMVNGLTEESQYASEGHADKRAAIDAKAARLMGLLKR